MQGKKISELTQYDQTDLTVIEVPAVNTDDGENYKVNLGVINTLDTNKADKSTTYTKTQVDASLATKADKATTYTKTEVDTTMATKADKSDTYTKTQVDTAVGNKVDKVAGKGLSTNDYDNTEKTSLSRLQAILGLYTDRASLTLSTSATGVQAGKAIVPAVAGSQYGKVADYTGAYVSQEFSLTRGDLLLIKPGKTSNDVFTVSQVTTSSDGNKTYTKVMSLNALAEVPTDGYLRFLVMPADMTVCITFFPSETAFQSEVKVMRCGSFASICTQVGNIYAELVSNYVQKNDYVPGLTAGSALRLVPHGEAATKEVIGLGGRKSGGKNAIDADINARISCIKGYTLMWRQQIPDGGTSGLEGGKITIGGTYQIERGGTTYNRPYLVCNPTDTAAEDVIEGVTVAAGWSVIRVGTEQDVAFAAGWKLIDLLLTFGTEKGHELNATADVAEAMGYVATESGKTAFDAWQAHTEQFAADMAYSAQTVIRNGRWDGLRSVGKDGDGNAFDFTRSIEQIRRQYFPEGMNGINIGTDSEVCDTIEAGQVVRRVGVVDASKLTWTTYQKRVNVNVYSTTISSIRLIGGGQYSNIFAKDILTQKTGQVWDRDNADMKNKISSHYAIKNVYLAWTTEFNNDAKAFMAYLKQRSDAGNPIVIYYELDTPIITPLTELNLTYPVSNTEGVESPVCEPSTNCSPLAANITYGLDAYATIVDLKKRVEALEKK